MDKMSYTEQGYDVPDAGNILLDGFGNFFQGAIDNTGIFVIIIILIIVILIAYSAIRYR